MIKIGDTVIDSAEIVAEYPQQGVERKIIDMLHSSDVVYSYTSIDQLKFEVAFRENIIDASIKLANTRFSFSVFRKARCNTDYWDLTGEGGFRIKDGVMPSDAINDIYLNSSKYSTECATAMVIVFCKAVVDTFPKNLSNELLNGVYLMNWQNTNTSLSIEYYRNLADYLPGDCRYFKNPDVNPETPEWQGENAIDLGNGTYYGHGIGIAPARVIIRALNSKRIPGSNTSAYLLDSATRPDFNQLAYIYNQ